MSDSIDRAQEIEEAQRTDAVALHARRGTSSGTQVCTLPGCDEGIDPRRTAMGATLCIEHQREREARDAHFRKWGRR